MSDGGKTENIVCKSSLNGLFLKALLPSGCAHFCLNLKNLLICAHKFSFSLSSMTILLDTGIGTHTKKARLKFCDN